ncbi:LysR family transcriptional regulator [Jannaschia aquimarina]|uniref:GltR protein n=1 Tax=Jannaschia aquimarina TaxID=935700 RepID=A0A0D1EG45_9RHOB|nr:LysR family transcriptional regulator [Jannaschia aquimarina]KIT15856.1 HTH-type transcriptional regulator GltR [Jannaschia aquimarina]SNT10130.1 DNA-binding transcriptional regulator, LysR family [Jannaschia aquimarina]
MDIALIRTFLAVAETGSFVAASGRLFVTQSAVSLRIQRLEDALGRPVFERSKAGATLTPAGVAFERYALSLLKIWEEARQQIAVPEGFSRALTIGAQYSLWPQLGFRWLDALRDRMPDLSLRAELGMPDRLTRFLIEGTCQVALTYTPQSRPGLTVEPALEDELILIAAWSGVTGPDDPDLKSAYIFSDWGPEFGHAHSVALPDLALGGLTLSLGALGADYLIGRHAACYMPARAVRSHLQAGRLHLVPDAPRFPYPAWAVFRDDLDPDVSEAARHCLGTVVSQAEDAQEAILADLERISRGDVEVMSG